MGVANKDWGSEVWRGGKFLLWHNWSWYGGPGCLTDLKRENNKNTDRNKIFVQFRVLEYSLDVNRYMMHTERRQSTSHWASRVNNIIWSAKEKAASRHSTHRLQANTAHDSNNCGSVIYIERSWTQWSDLAINEIFFSFLHQICT